MSLKKLNPYFYYNKNEYVYQIYLILWSNECNIEKAKKDIVPFSELLQINMEFWEKFGIDD